MECASITTLLTFPPLGISSAVNVLLTGPSPNSGFALWVVSIVAAVCSYALARMFEFIVGILHGVWIEFWSVFVLWGFGAFIIFSLAKFLYYSPNINNYLGGNVLVGVFIGGLMFIGVKLGKEAIIRRSVAK